MLSGFVGNAAFGMASVVSGEAIAAATAGERMKKSFAFGQFAETQIEKPGTMPIDENDAKARKSSQQAGERLEMKITIDEKLGQRLGKILSAHNNNVPPKVLLHEAV